MKIYKFPVFILGLVYLYVTTTYTYGESSTCLMVYKEGGAPAVFQSPKCPRWKLSDYGSRSKSRSRSPTMTCQSAVHKGRRKYQEDRTFCSLDLHIPFPGPTGITDVSVGIVAVFDGHNGVEASEMASKLLLEYFTLHTHFLLDTTFSILSKKPMRRLPNKGEKDHVSQTLTWDEEVDTLEIGRFKLSLSAIFDGSFHLEILKESLLRAIHDIDASFSKEASRNNFDSGSTATVILIADGQILVANIGDSKAFLCSEIFQSPSEAKATLLRLYRQKRQDGTVSRIKDRGLKLEASNGLALFHAKELTRDHHPDRDDEKVRVESAGGYVLQWGGVSRINGQLAVSRAIGDVSFKSYGVISVPEVTDWQILTDNDSYLVAASDGVFEKLSPQDVCDLLWEIHTYGAVSSEPSSLCSYSLADCIVNTAFQKGSMDNLAAVVVPFRSTGFSSTGLQEYCDSIYERSGDNNPSELIELEHAPPIIGKFDRLLVKGKHSSFACFYLSENLDENDDYTFCAQKDDKENIYDSPPALPDAIDHCCSNLL
ncbi:hypothetical protein LguiA_011534 [Lonicera macranthoides]